MTKKEILDRISDITGTCEEAREMWDTFERVPLAKELLCYANEIWYDEVITDEQLLEVNRLVTEL